MSSSAFELASIEGRRPTWEVALMYPDEGGWSETAYLQLDPGRHVEFSKGHLEFQPMPDETHQAIVGLLYVWLRAVAASTGGRVRIAPLPVRLWQEQYREPDVCFMRREHLDRCRGKYWEGADLVFEILSESNRDHDLVTKRDEYARAGIGEYWIVDPRERKIHVLVLGESGYTERTVAGDGERLASPSLPEFVIDVTELFDSD